MRLRTRNPIGQIVGANNSAHGKRLFAEPRDPIVTKMSRDQPAGAVRQPHVNGGHRHTPNTDTLVSVIVGVCQQDPERWRHFDVIEDIDEDMSHDFKSDLS
jgi:hypothetical protein